MSLLYFVTLIVAQANSAPAAPSDNVVVQMTGPNGTTATMSMDPTSTDDRLAKAADSIKSGRAADALPLLEQIIAENEASHKRSSNTIFYSSPNLAESLIYATLAGMQKKKGVVLDGTWSTANFLKGFALVDLNRGDEAIRWFDKAVALAPMNSQYLAERAEWYKSRRDWKKAFKGFEEARSWASLADDEVKVDWESRAIRGMAFVRIEQGKLGEAERLLSEALKLNPSDKRAREELELVGSMRKR